MSQSARLGAPQIQPAQVDKATTHNEAIALFDVAICAAIDGFLVDTPPASPTLGSSYVLGANPTGAWAGHALALAGYTEGGWRFIGAFDGLAAMEKTSGETAVFRGGAWAKGEAIAAKLSIGGNQVVGARGAAVADPAGGAIVDAEARAALAAILARLRQHGLIAN
jgi:hypothetical protein